GDALEPELPLAIEAAGEPERDGVEVFDDGPAEAALVDEADGLVDARAHRLAGAREHRDGLAVGGVLRAPFDEALAHEVEDHDRAAVRAAREPLERAADGALGEVIGHALPDEDGGPSRIEARGDEAVEEVLRLEVAAHVGGGLHG